MYFVESILVKNVPTFFIFMGNLMDVNKLCNSTECIYQLYEPMIMWNVFNFSIYVKAIDYICLFFYKSIPFILIDNSDQVLYLFPEILSIVPTKLS